MICSVYTSKSLNDDDAVTRDGLGQVTRYELDDTSLLLLVVKVVRGLPRSLNPNFGLVSLMTPTVIVASFALPMLH